ncbi:MAG: 2Fe-2S iron-sulfur cluster-binding protein [Tepidisphaeraceae bacterium]|jgi:NADH-quinone oxidoreductase subunit G
MPKITVDGKLIECKDRQVVLQACLDAGHPLPYYCYHPGLSIPASCRICLVEVEGIPKLVPSCQTVVRDGMVVHSRSPKAVANQKLVMEYLLINHPLDCPICDQAGECTLQDYSYQYGRSQSRFEEDKAKKPKKDVGDKILLYSDRCIMCTRCVRFTREISGTGELYVDGRGYREEIDIFPGKPCNNKLAGNVVDLCPVGALLDKDFLFKQRVWLLTRTESISPVDSGGENIYLEHNEGIVYRIKPRENPQVNQWWISDDTRYSYKVLTEAKRLKKAMVLRSGGAAEAEADAAVAAAVARLRALAAESPGCLYAVLSPMMACEEAFLLASAIRAIDSQAVLVLGPVPTSGKDEVFKNPITGQQTFVIKAEKVPNAAGVRRVLALLGGRAATWDDLAAAARPEVKNLKGGWIVGGYHSNWISGEIPAIIKSGFKVVQDLLPTPLGAAADVLLPAAAWAEKDGCWENYAGQIQPFEAAVPPPEGVMRDGQIYLSLLDRRGQYNAQLVRREMGEPFASVQATSRLVQSPATEFVPL